MTVGNAPRAPGGAALPGGRAARRGSRGGAPQLRGAFRGSPQLRIGSSVRIGASAPYRRGLTGGGFGGPPRADREPCLRAIFRPPGRRRALRAAIPRGAGAIARPRRRAWCCPHQGARAASRPRCRTWGADARGCSPRPSVPCAPRWPPARRHAHRPKTPWQGAGVPGQGSCGHVAKKSPPWAKQS